MKAPNKPPPVEIHIDELRRLPTDAQTRPLTEAESDQLLSVAMSHFQVGELLADKKATIAKLRKMLFGTSNEKTDVVLGEREAAATTTTGADTAGTDPPGMAAEAKTPAKGHGRNGADAYRSATHTRVDLVSVKARDMPGARPSPLRRGVRLLRRTVSARPLGLPRGVPTRRHNQGKGHVARRAAVAPPGEQRPGHGRPEEVASCAVRRTQS